MPSVTIEMELNMANLLPAVGHGVEDAHFDFVRISVGNVVGGFESHTLEV